MEKLTSGARALIRTAIPENHTLLKRLVVTPSRIICLPALPIATNRLLRYFGSRYEFIVVSFRDEQLQKLQGLDVLKRVEKCLKQGITVVNKYWLFCASGSQIRDHKAYFVAADSYAEVSAEAEARLHSSVFG